jgi:N-acetylglucosamine-6-phosphate deacetylase
MVSGGKATLKNGTLAGSVLKLDEGVKRMIRDSICTLEDTIYLTSINPAKQLNLYGRKGSIAPGKDGDLVVLDDQYDVVMTLCHGKVVYQRSGGIDPCPLEKG